MNFILILSQCKDLVHPMSVKHEGLIQFCYILLCLYAAWIQSVHVTRFSFMQSVYWLVPSLHVSDTLSDLNSVCLKTGAFSALLGECHSFWHKLEAWFYIIVSLCWSNYKWWFIYIETQIFSHTSQKAVLITSKYLWIPRNIMLSPAWLIYFICTR
jgi:hypothetical protein